MRSTPYWLALLPVVAAAGCMPNQRIAEEDFSRVWSLHEDLTRQAPYHQAVFGERKLPARLTIRQKKSVVLSTITIVRAFDRMKQGVAEIDFSISPAHTETLVGLLAEAREALRGLATLARTDRRADRKHWAETLAHTLAQVEHITRLTSVEEAEKLGPDAPEPLGISAGPLLEILALYLNERSDGALLGDLEPTEVDRLRTVLTQMILRLGFDLAGKQLPSDLRKTTTERMRGSNRLDALEGKLADLLLERVEQSPPAARQPQTKKIVDAVVSWAPRGLRVLEAFIAQWDRMEKIELEFRRLDDQPVVVATFTVLPGEKVRIGDVVILQPALVFRGTSRIAIIPEAPGTGETLVLFEPVDGGGVEMRFEGLAYGLVRLFGFPLANGMLREIRVFSHRPKRGHQLVNVAVFTEATGDRRDPRRLMTFQDVRRTRIVRKAFAVTSVEDLKEQIFNYITPKRRYYYRRLKQPNDD